MKNAARRAVAFAVVAAWPTAAFAQVGITIAAPAPPPNEELHNHVAAPTRSLELGAGVGYTQPFGDIQNGASLGSIAAAGAGLEVDAGYRASPIVLVGVYGTGSKFSLSNVYAPGTDIYSASAGVQANLHVRPKRSIDPWVGIGTGWRGLWSIENDVGTTTRHGLELARFQAGVDIRAVPQLAVSPVLGADMTMFLTENAAQSDAYRAMAGRLNTFVFAGVMGRFDLGPTTR